MIFFSLGIYHNTKSRINQQMAYYEILGVSKNASNDEIKKHHENMTKIYKDKPKFRKKLDEIYNVLMNPYTRGKYDAQLESNIRIPLFDPLRITQLLNDNISVLHPNPNSKSFSYSSKTMLDENGKMVEETAVKRFGGKTKRFHQKYVVDKNGKKKILEKEGDKKMVQ